MRWLGQSPPAIQGRVVWLTGLPASGKTTIGWRLVKELNGMGHWAMLLDGDELRAGINADLDFSREGRRETCRRLGWLAHTIRDQGAYIPGGVVPVVSAVTPYREDRDAVRRTFGGGQFIEVHVHAPLAVCERRDPKGLYAKARKREILGFTGISDPYEEPDNPELILDTEKQSVDLCVKVLVALLLS